MTLPTVIGEPSPLDPLVLLPLPGRLPESPLATLEPLAAELAAHLDGAVNAADLPTIAAQMRSSTRTAQVLMNSARAGAAEARASLDDADVQLRTVMYELARVREESAMCMEYEWVFTGGYKRASSGSAPLSGLDVAEGREMPAAPRTRHTLTPRPMYESLDLPEEGAFVASAAPEVLAALPPEDDWTRSYALIIARLEAELAAIIEHEGQAEALTKERDSLQRARREIKAKFDAVDVWLADYAKTTSAMATKIREVSKTPSAAAVASSAAAAAASQAPAAIARTPSPSPPGTAAPPSAEVAAAAPAEA